MIIIIFFIIFIDECVDGIIYFIYIRSSKRIFRVYIFQILCEKLI